MAQKEHKAGKQEVEKARESISYDMGKMKAVITPVYNEEIGKPLHVILLGMIKNDVKKCHKEQTQRTKKSPKKVAKSA